MKVPFLADNDLRKAIVRGTVRREPQMDFVSARLDRLADSAVLALAANPRSVADRAGPVFIAGLGGFESG
jgi:hypothetical protein